MTVRSNFFRLVIIAGIVFGIVLTGCTKTRTANSSDDQNTLTENSDSYSSAENSNNDFEENQTEDKEQNENNKKIEDFIATLYNDYVFGAGNFENIASNFSPKILKALKESYKDEYGDDFGEYYATWDFGPFAPGVDREGETKVISIKSIGNDFFLGHFIEMGEPFACKFKAKVIDNKVMIEEYEIIK